MKLAKNIINGLRVIGGNFSTLRIRNIRLYMLGQSVNLVGDWMQQTAQAWVVWELTHKATALGITAFLSQIPFFIFGPWVGVIADRFNRRKILLITQFLAMLFAFILAFLIQTNHLLLWHVYLLALLLGIATAFNVTAEQAFIGDIAGAGNIRKAVALNNIINQLSRLIGPALAGWLIASAGITLAFWYNGFSIVISIICIFIIRSRQEIKKSDDSGLKQFKEGLSFLRNQRLLRLIILFAAIQTFFGLSIVQLLPAYSTIVLHGNAKTLGQLVGSAGAGALVGIVFVLPFVQRIKRPCIAIGGSVVWAGIWYLVFSFSRNLPLAMICQFMASLGAANVLTLSAGLTQELTPAHLRARVLSTFLMIIFGLQPVASYLVGRTADLIGINITMLINGGSMILLTLVLLGIPKLFKLRASVQIPAFKNPGM
ncbi:MAG TPA: MFS transporter [Chitinophagaceae bacterium]|nr:MFS transporter [Chitinophagaceae bacterium]